MTTGSDGDTAVTTPVPSDETTAKPTPIPVFLVNQDGTRIAKKVIQAVLGTWGAGITMGGLILGTVGLFMGFAWMRGPVQAVCEDRKLEFCADFKADFEAKFPALTSRYAKRDAGDFSKMVNGMMGGFTAVMELQTHIQQLTQTLNEAQERFDDPVWKDEVDSKVDAITSTLDQLGEGKIDPDVKGALDKLKGALGSVNEATQNGNRDGFNTGMASLQTAMQEFVALQVKLMTGALQSIN